MGGGEQPPMDVLKNWMYEKWDFNEAGLQNTDSELTQLDADMITEIDQFCEGIPFNSLPFHLHQEQAQSFDWNNAQYGAELTSESNQLGNSTGAIVDETLILTSQHHPQAYATSYFQ